MKECIKLRKSKVKLSDLSHLARKKTKGRQACLPPSAPALPSPGPIIKPLRTSLAGAAPHLQHLHLVPQPFSAELHHGVGAESVPYLVLVDGGEPEEKVVLQLQRRNQDRLVTGVDAAKSKWRADVHLASVCILEHQQGGGSRGPR